MFNQNKKFKVTQSTQKLCCHNNIKDKINKLMKSYLFISFAAQDVTLNILEN